MWIYEKRLQYPVKIKTPNAKLAKIIISQYGGPYAGTETASPRDTRSVIPRFTSSARLIL